MFRLVPVSLSLALLCACSSVTVVRVGNATAAGQTGAALEPVELSPCRTLDEDRRDACVLTVAECPAGIAEVRAQRLARATRLTVSCFVPNASTIEGDPDDL